MSEETSRRTIAVIDGNSLMHRAYHAVPPYMTAPDGTPTNAIFGFMQMFVKLIETYPVWGVIVCFDKGKPRVRMEMLKQYKANRPPQDEALHVQFPVVKELLAALSVPVIELEGWEGDDLLGTIAKRGEGEGFDFLLFTGDRDMYQLSDEHIKVVSTKRGMSEVCVMDPAAVEDLYSGITPELVPDFYGLKGDTADNIPGVPGVGPKKAAALIQEYGSLDAVLAAADEIPGKMGENIRAHKEDALVSRKVATIMCDAPIELDLDAAKFPSFDRSTAEAAFSKLAFKLIEKKFFAAANTEGVVASGGGSAELGEALEELTLPRMLVGQEAEACVTQAIADQTWMGVYFESQETPELFSQNETLYVACEAGMAQIEGQSAKDMLLQCVEKGRVSAIDAKALLHHLAPKDKTRPALVDPQQLAPERLFDAGVAAYLLNSSLEEYSLATLSENYLEARVPRDTQVGAIHAYVAQKLVKPLTDALSKQGALPTYETMEMPLVLILCAMEREGLEVDRLVLRNQTSELMVKHAKLKASIIEMAGEDFNLGSPSQLSRVLFDVLELPSAGLKRTKKGFVSTNAAVLEDLAKEHQVVRDVLTWREQEKVLTTYLEALPTYIAGDGCIHTTFNQTVTTTGRLSSSNPNLQNIPVKSDLGRAVRKAFVVPKTHVFLAADYSQIELRLLAHFSGDEGLIEAFKEGNDFHAETAAKVFGVDAKDVSSELRRRAKAVNFGIVYGQQAFGLARTLSISNKEAQAMIDAYFSAYPAVRTYLDQTIASAKRLGFAETMFGRRRYLPELTSGNKMVIAAGEREAMNLPMQGTAADIIKLAMIAVERRLREDGLEAKLMLQIHDELDLTVPKTELNQVSELVAHEMEHVVDLAVPLKVDVSYGENWAEAK